MPDAAIDLTPVMEVAADGRSWEEDLAKFIELREAEQDTIWTQADMALAMTAKYGRKTAKMLANEVGLSTTYVRQLVATSKAFPADKRAQDMSFSIHRTAAMTEDPDRWLVTAIDKGWSQRDLAQAIKDTKDKMSESEQATAAAERLEQAIRTYNEHFQPISGRKAVLSWVVEKRVRLPESAVEGPAEEIGELLPESPSETSPEASEEHALVLGTLGRGKVTRMVQPLVLVDAEEGTPSTEDDEPAEEDE
ncbi:MAG: hypothetical protein ACYCRD_04560 [Leptospirillum sp.]